MRAIAAKMQRMPRLNQIARRGKVCLFSDLTAELYLNFKQTTAIKLRERRLRRESGNLEYLKEKNWTLVSKYHVWQKKRFCTRMIYTLTTRKRIFRLAISKLNFDQKVLNTTEWRRNRRIKPNLTLFNPKSSKPRLRNLARATVQCEFNPDIAIFITLIFSRGFPNMVLNENECSNALYNANNRELHV